MYYSPVNDSATKVSLYEAIRNGVSSDGQLYLPQKFPVLPSAFFHNIASMSLTDIAFVALNMLFGEDIPAETLRDISRDALDKIDIPFVRTGEKEFSLDLTKGPTGSYHDFSARILAEYLKTITPDNRINIIVISNSNAANATADAFASLPGATVYALYPRGILSYERRGQLLLRDNVIPVEVDGSYSDCRRITLETILNKDVAEKTLTMTANSENLAVLLPRIIYFFYAYARLALMEIPLDNVVIEFETEHLGNLTAAVIAEKMGMPRCRLYARFSNNSTQGDNKVIMPRMVQLLNDTLTVESLMESAKIPPRPEETVIRLITQAPPEPQAVPRDRTKRIIHIGTSSAPIVRHILKDC